MEEGIEDANMERDLRIRFLDGFQVAVGPRVISDAEWKLRKAKSLVKLLALAPGYRLHREQVMDVLWPDFDPQSASNNLRKVLHVARHALKGTHALNLASSAAIRYLDTQEELLVLGASGSVWLDVEVFEASAAAARRPGDPESYREAIALYTGDFLPEDLYEEWTVRRREELRNAHLSLLVELARLYEARGDAQAAIGVLQQVIEVEPLYEEAHLGLMRLYAMSGQRHQAVRQYQQLREALKQELDTDPDASAQQLYQEIIAGRSSADDNGEFARSGASQAPKPNSGSSADESSLVARQQTLNHNLPAP